MLKIMDKKLRQKKRETILNSISKLDNLPSLSSLTMRLIEMASDDNVPIKRLAKTIEKEPALTARLLRMVNSAFYSGYEPITTVSQAIVLIGFNLTVLSYLIT